MTVSSAMDAYSFARAKQQKHVERCHRCASGWTRSAECHRIHQAVDAASLTLDLAYAVESEERIRRSVAF